MKIVGIDLGDRWIGTALSDNLHITCRPHKTIQNDELLPFLEQLITDGIIDTVVVGYPRTLQGRESEQTKKISSQFNRLQEHFASLMPTQKISWFLWDERLTSKQALSLPSLKKRDIKKAKVDAHSFAAALILENFLDARKFSKTS